MLEVMARSGGRVLGLAHRGRLGASALGATLSSIARQVDEHGATRLLLSVERLPAIGLEVVLEALRGVRLSGAGLERVAVVSDARALERYERVARLLFPLVEIHHFDAAELETAWRWLEAPEATIATAP